MPVELNSLAIKALGEPKPPAPDVSASRADTSPTILPHWQKDLVKLNELAKKALGENKYVGQATPPPGQDSLAEMETKLGRKIDPGENPKKLLSKTHERLGWQKDPDTEKWIKEGLAEAQRLAQEKLADTPSLLRPDKKPLDMPETPPTPTTFSPEREAELLREYNESLARAEYVPEEISGVEAAKNAVKSGGKAIKEASAKGATAVKQTWAEHQRIEREKETHKIELKTIKATGDVEAKRIKAEADAQAKIASAEAKAHKIKTEADAKAAREAQKLELERQKAEESRRRGQTQAPAQPDDEAQRLQAKAAAEALTHFSPDAKTQLERMTELRKEFNTRANNTNITEWPDDLYNKYQDRADAILSPPHTMFSDKFAARAEASTETPTAQKVEQPQTEEEKQRLKEEALGKIEELLGIKLTGGEDEDAVVAIARELREKFGWHPEDGTTMPYIHGGIEAAAQRAARETPITEPAAEAPATEEPIPNVTVTPGETNPPTADETAPVEPVLDLAQEHPVRTVDFPPDVKASLDRVL